MNDSAETVYVFDLDGVITDPRDSSVDEAVVSRIGELLADGHPITVNTGRSYEWVDQHLVARLLVSQHSEAFSRLLMVCEKGGEQVSLESGKPVITPSEFALHPSQYATAKHVFESMQPQLDTMFWDETKRTMATIEKRPSAALNSFHEQQQQLASSLNNAFAAQDVKVDVTTIATDVESPSAGKHAGAELILRWIRQLKPEVDTFVCVGDSVSDYAMAQYFAEQGATSSFVFVGAPGAVFAEHADVLMIKPAALYSKGTMEYLDSLL